MMSLDPLYKNISYYLYLLYTFYFLQLTFYINPPMPLVNKVYRPPSLSLSTLFYIATCK